MKAVPLVLSEQEMQPRSGRAPFSNSTEGDAWMQRWCGTCVHDDMERGGNVGCPLALIGLVGATPRQWVDRERGGLSDRYTCTAYDPAEPGVDARED